MPSPMLLVRACSPPQEIAAKAEVAAQRAKEAAAHRKELIAERCNAARDARNLRNRGAGRFSVARLSCSTAGDTRRPFG